jgi:hypothetical protein
MQATLRKNRRITNSSSHTRSPHGLNQAYWLKHCEGYQVESLNGRVGFVDDVGKGAGEETITVRAGVLGQRLVVYSARDIALVVPRAQTVFLYAAAEPLAESSR